MHKKIICSALSAAMFLTLFSACGRSEESVVNTKNSSFIEQEEVVDSPAKIFFSAWNGSEITADTAREHGMIFMDSSEESDMRWAEFCECVKSGTEAEITVCTSTQVIHAESSLEGDSGVLTIESEDFSEGSMKLFSKKLSADSLYSVCENGFTVYYAGSNKLYQTENVTSELTDVPFEQKIYKCSSEANMTFPYQKMFSNYDDFSEYYLKYNGELQIQEMKKDMEALSKVSNVQLVSMHWGEEYQMEPTEEQEDLANYLNELGAEVVIGSHPHVIEPAKVIKGKKQDTLVYYSLGNYTSAQDMDITMVGGMASFTLNYDPDTKKTSFTDTKFIPLITWFDVGYNAWKTYPIEDYNDSLAQTHNLASNYDLSKEWVQQFVQSVMQDCDGVEVVLE